MGRVIETLLLFNSSPAKSRDVREESNSEGRQEVHEIKREARGVSESDRKPHKATRDESWQN